MLIFDNPLSVCIEATLPKELDAVLAEVLSRQPAAALSDTEVDALKIGIQTRGTPNYAKCASTFAFLYFGANFAKAHLSALTFTKPAANRFRRIVDLGAGSGASLAGTVSGLKAVLGDDLHIDEVVAVDRSAEQLDIFKQAVAPWLNKTIQGARVTAVCADAIDFAASFEPQDTLIVVSYLQAELGVLDAIRFREVLEQRSSTRSGNALRILESAKSRRGLEVGMEGNRSIILPYDDVRIFLPCVESLTLSRKPKFAEVDVQRIVREYGRVWREHDLDGLEALFTSDARYTIAPERTLVGIDEIKAYWAHNADRQRNVHFSANDISRIAAGRFRVMWGASFERSDTRNIRHLEGLMLLGVNENGRIFSLEEAYSQVVRTNE